MKYKMEKPRYQGEGATDLTRPKQTSTSTNVDKPVKTRVSAENVDKLLELSGKKLRAYLCDWFLKSIAITPPSSKSADQLAVMRAGLNYFALVGDKLQAVDPQSDASKLQGIVDALDDSAAPDRADVPPSSTTDCNAST